MKFRLQAGKPKTEKPGEMGNGVEMQRIFPPESLDLADHGRILGMSQIKLNQEQLGSVTPGLGVREVEQPGAVEDLWIKRGTPQLMRLEIIDQVVQDDRLIPEKEVQEILVGILQILLMPKQEFQEGIEGILPAEGVEVEYTYAGIAVDLSGEILGDDLLLRRRYIAGQLAAQCKIRRLRIQQGLDAAAAQDIAVQIQNLPDPLIQQPGGKQAEYGAGGPFVGGNERRVIIADQPEGAVHSQQCPLVLFGQSRAKADEGNAAGMVLQNGQNQIDALVNIVVVEGQQDDPVILTEGAVGSIQLQSEMRIETVVTAAGRDRNRMERGIAHIISPIAAEPRLYRE
jgi:hypothetical protein